jgi:hypothetical protein
MSQKTGAWRVKLLIESARHSRCGWFCCDDHGCNHRVVTARMTSPDHPARRKDGGRGIAEQRGRRAVRRAAALQLSDRS